MRMPFGKHEGEDVDELPKDYLQWLCTIRLAPKLRAEVESVLHGTLKPKPESVDREGVVSVSHVDGRLGWSDHKWIRIPSLFEFLPAGDGALTRRVKKSAKTVYVVVERTEYGTSTLGLWAHRATIAACRRKIVRTPEEEKKRRREREQERDTALFAEWIREDFPGMPEDDVLRCASHACMIGSGRVGRSTNCDDPVGLAVLAYARHRYTDYDRQLESAKDRWDYADIKEAANCEADAILDQWSRTEGDA